MINNKTLPFAVMSPAYNADMHRRVKELINSRDLADSVKKCEVKSVCRSAAKR